VTSSRTMPHRNRVTPYGEIVAIPERGTLMGNRGVIHADGVIVHRGSSRGAGRASRGAAFLLRGGALRGWTHAGYGPAEPADPAERVTVLTPRVTVETIRRGYAVRVHASGL
jgi:hypothetical protein